MKKINLISISLVTIFALSSCGSSSSSTSDTTEELAIADELVTTAPIIESDNIELGIGYYVDSAVSGVKYSCGNQNGVTDEKGKFIFEKGKSCTFSLNDFKLRDVDANELSDDIKIIEDDIKVAQFLQSLDVDGNVSNGISITPEVIGILYDNGVSKLPETADEIVDIIQKLKDSNIEFNGKLVSEEVAKAHIEETIKELGISVNEPTPEPTPPPVEPTPEPTPPPIDPVPVDPVPVDPVPVDPVPVDPVPVDPVPVDPVPVDPVPVDPVPVDPVPVDPVPVDPVPVDPVPVDPVPVDPVPVDLTRGVLVDPYIEGATLYEDVDNDGEFDEGEPVSTPTTKDGEFDFNQTLTEGNIVRIKEQGMHEGKLYDLYIAGIVDDENTIDVVSTLTTFQTKGLIPEQIADILNLAMVDSINLSQWNISASQIVLNPLNGGLENKAITDISDTDLVAIQASLATYGILKLMNTLPILSELRGDELYGSGMDNTSGYGELHNISKLMLPAITTFLNKTMLLDISNSIDELRAEVTTNTRGVIDESLINSSIVTPDTNLIIQISVAIIDRVTQLAVEASNNTQGTDREKVSSAIDIVATTIETMRINFEDIGSKFYGIKYADQLSNLRMQNKDGSYMEFNQLPDMDSLLVEGFNANRAGNTTYRFNASNILVAQ